MHDQISTTTFFIKDGLSYLQLDHDRFEMMFHALQNAHGAEKKEILIQLSKQLLEHMALENEHLDPLIEGQLGHEWVKKCQQDDDNTKLLLDTIKNSANNEELNTNIEKLISLQREHMKNEELEIFVDLRAKLNQDQLEVLYNSLETAKRQLEAPGNARHVLETMRSRVVHA
jgi:hemerythrin-like domain-containing protein